jgi:hypothetical protein
MRGMQRREMPAMPGPPVRTAAATRQIIRRKEGKGHENEEIEREEKEGQERCACQW